MKWIPGTVMAVALLAGRLGAQAEAAPKPAAAPDVDAELSVIDGLLDQHDWKHAYDKIMRLLNRAGPSDTLVPRIKQLDDALGAASFGLQYVPTSSALFKGRAWDWNPDKRWVRLTYDGKTPAPADKSWKPNQAVSRLLPTTRDIPTFLDFKPVDHHVAGGLLVHDAHFGEQMTLTIEGTLPDACDLMPHVFVCIGEAGYYHVQPTWAHYQKRGYSDPTQGTITLVQQGASKVLDTDLMPINKYDLLPGHYYKVKVMVTPERIAVTINAMGHLDVARDPALGGQVAFIGFPGVTSTEIKGDLEPAWFDNVTAPDRSRARQDFDAGWPTRARGPNWWPDFVSQHAAQGNGSSPGKGPAKSAPSQN